MLIGAWAVFSAALVGLGWMSLNEYRRRMLHHRINRFLHHRVGRRRIERRDWRAYIERRYRKP
jgi:hypothetical protein